MPQRFGCLLKALADHHRRDRPAEDLLWIRDEFLHSKKNFGKVVVHGHTPTEDREVLPNRINIDTGAFATGPLTWTVLQRGVGDFFSPNNQRVRIGIASRIVAWLMSQLRQP